MVLTWQRLPKRALGQKCHPHSLQEATAAVLLLDLPPFKATATGKWLMMTFHRPRTPHRRVLAHQRSDTGPISPLQAPLTLTLTLT
jgi:hypothetical protein